MISENEERIYQLRAQISALENKLNKSNNRQVVDSKNKKIEESIKHLKEELNKCLEIQKQEKAVEDEKSRQISFFAVKRAYKAHSIWDRMIATINGKRPNWKKVSKLSERELDHLWRVNQGDTAWAKDREAYAREYNEEKKGSNKKTEEQLKRQAKQYNWEKFLIEMQNDSVREMDMKNEEKHGERIR